MITNQEFYRSIATETRPELTTSRGNEAEISRLVHAAIISKRFCAALLADPLTAIDRGYMNEHFSFSAPMRARIASVKAKDLSEFAQKLMAAPARQPAKRKQMAHRL